MKATPIFGVAFFYSPPMQYQIHAVHVFARSECNERRGNLNTTMSQVAEITSVVPTL